MIFTDKFVYVHEPKTGGTFVTTMLFRLYGLRWTRLTHLRNALVGSVSAHHPRYGPLVHNSNKHGGCNEIPVAERGKKILATVRNPFDLYVSQYEFGWWKGREFLKYYEAVPNFKRDYPNFPNLDFPTYVRLSNATFRSLANGAAQDTNHGPGLITEQFFKFYFRDPSTSFKRLAEGIYNKRNDATADMHDLHFVRTDDLNKGLYDFLIEEGYGEDDVSFIAGEGKILPRGRGRSTAQKWEKYYTAELKAWVREREDFLFKLFPEFDV